jgi:hypothetical protein
MSGWDSAGNTKWGRIIVPLTSCLTDFGLVCFANKNKNCHLSYSLFQTSQTGGQWYSETSPFSIPWIVGFEERGTELMVQIKSDFCAADNEVTD